MADNLPLGQASLRLDEEMIIADHHRCSLSRGRLTLVVMWNPSNITADIDLEIRLSARWRAPP
jgi:hypothetical protein